MTFANGWAIKLLDLFKWSKSIHVRMTIMTRYDKMCLDMTGKNDNIMMLCLVTEHN